VAGAQGTAFALRRVGCQPGSVLCGAPGSPNTSEHVNAPPVVEARVPPHAQHSFVPVEIPGTTYIASMGYYQPDGHWVSLVSSMPVQTPPAGPSLDRTALFATVADMPAVDRGEAPAERPPWTPAPSLVRPVVPQQTSTAVPAPPAWTPDQEQALAAMTRELESLPAPSGSWEMAEVIAPSAKVILPAGSEVPVPIHISSPMGAGPVPARPEAFWFNVNAELVIYGGTEPDARVTIGGRPIRLRPDGTFNYRFALPDGTYLLPIAAISKAGEVRQAELGFSRWTLYLGEVGAHPQDPSLQPPSAESLPQ